jgi:hypothetical protein
MIRACRSLVFSRIALIAMATLTAVIVLPTRSSHAGTVPLAAVEFLSFWSIDPARPVARMTTSEDDTPQSNPGGGTTLSDSWYEAGATVSLEGGGDFCGGKAYLIDDYYLSECIYAEGPSDVLISLDSAAYELGFGLKEGGYSDMVVDLYAADDWTDFVGTVTISGDEMENASEHPSAGEDQADAFMGLVSDTAFQSARLDTGMSWTSINDVIYDTVPEPSLLVTQLASLLVLAGVGYARRF